MFSCLQVLKVLFVQPYTPPSWFSCLCLDIFVALIHYILIVHNYISLFDASFACVYCGFGELWVIQM